MNQQEHASDIVKHVDLMPPHGEQKVLLHSCCAPCAGEMMEQLVANGIDLTIFFYNPNIHPKREYEIRKQENIRYAEKMGIPFIDGDYDVQDWFARAKGMERAPERGERCTMCFDRRFDVTAEYAKDHGFKVFSSSLGISRWKNLEQINDCGERSAAKVNETIDGDDEKLTYWTYNWRKGGGSARMYEIAKREEFYAQQYCGCIFSLRDTNEWRESKGREKIEIGETWYEEKLGE